MSSLSLESSRRRQRGAHYLLIGVSLGMAFLLGRLWFLQIVHGGTYNDKHDRQSVRMIRMPAVRGGVYDRNGVALVKNRLMFRLKIYLQDIRPYFKGRYDELKRARAEEYAQVSGRHARRAWRARLQKEARYLVVRDFAWRATSMAGRPETVRRKDFERHYDQRLGLPFPISGELSEDQAALFLEAIDPPPGVNLEVQAVRDYRFGSRAAHALGHVKRRDFPPGRRRARLSVSLSHARLRRGRPGLWRGMDLRRRFAGAGRRARHENQLSGLPRRGVDL